MIVVACFCHYIINSFFWPNTVYCFRVGSKKGGIYSSDLHFTPASKSRICMCFTLTAYLCTIVYMIHLNYLRSLKVVALKVKQNSE